MILVIKKTSAVTAFICRANGVQMKDIAAHTGIGLTTVCNIIKTLVNIGWVQKKENKYFAGPEILSLTAPHFRFAALSFTAGQYVKKLAKELNEGAVLACIRGYELFNIHKFIPDNEIVVNPIKRGLGSIYTNATGRILLAYMTPEEISEIIRHCGEPSEFWTEINNYEHLKNELAKIKKNGYCLRRSENSLTAGLAVPVFSSDGSPWAALGIFLPASRLIKNNHQFVIKTLQKYSSIISQEIKYQE
ncbi:MAG: hypothetical protein A2096_02920 [Spirochaetes bacterium GWF1_41_5]|nr:MAG: hypothetical protein A2096_02920 [Spirochaetes bacterium GWF1_41_5]